MTHRCRIQRGLLALTLILLAACSGGSNDSSSSSGGGDPGSSGPPEAPAEAIEGIATPSSVSVVTATNAS